MLKRISVVLSASALAVAVALAPVPGSAAHAVTDADIAAQTRTVQTSLVGTLTEYVKLLQLSFIQRLEAEVARLQALVEAQQ